MVLNESPDRIADKYAHILDTCEPFLVSYTANWPHLELEPLGVPIPAERTITATALSSRRVIDGLHHLDGFSFGDKSMAMERWVLFDCGEFPGIVFGFGRRAAELSHETRVRYDVAESAAADVFVPLSMWVAIRCAEPAAWFGHNLSSANLVLADDERLPGLGTLTKLLGVAVTRAHTQYGATQWKSPSLGIHLKLGDLQLLSAWTPAHTHSATFSYRVDVDPERLSAAIGPEWRRPDTDRVERWVASDDTQAFRALHDELEAGQDWHIVALERGDPNRIGLRRGDS